MLIIVGGARLHWPTVTAVVIVVVAVSARVATHVLDPPAIRWTVEGPQASPGAADAIISSLIYLVYLGVTVLLVTRAPKNPVSWLVAMTTLAGTIGGWSEAATLSPGTGPWYGLASWVQNWYFPVYVAGIVLVSHVFPTGRRLAGWLGWATIAATVGFVLSVVALMIGQEPDVTANPVGIDLPDVLEKALLAGAVTGWLIGLLTIVPILVVRFRRSTGNERQQLKWFMYCAVLAIVMWWAQAALPALFYVAVTLPVIGIAIALLRFRLYDLDRVMSRTTSYLIVLGLLVATYTAVVALVTAVIPDAGSLAVAAATLTAAAIARPVFTRVKGRLDRRFDRARYDAARTVEAFSARLRHQVDRDEVQDDLLGSVKESLAPRAIGLWLPDGG